jgi:hypothetical protein
MMARWGMPSPDFALTGKNSDPGVTNVRNVTSPHWRRWLGIENRCIVPWTSFSENEVLPDGSRPTVWFAFDETRPLAFFAGIWTRWTSVRKVKEGETTNDIFAFLTTEPRDARADSGRAGRSDDNARLKQIEFCAAIHAWALRAGNHPPRRRSGGWRKDGREHLRVHGPSCCARLLSGQSPASARPLSTLRLANGLYPQTPAARVPMDSLSQPFHKHSDTERACRFDRSPLCARPGNRR